MKESGCKEGDSVSGSPGPTSSSEKDITFAPVNSDGDQTESPSDVGDSTHSIETGGEKDWEKISHSCSAVVSERRRYAPINVLPRLP